MKIKKWFLCFILSLFMIACAAPIAKNIQVYPGTPEALYGKVVITLQELGYQIKHTDAASGVILAEKLTGQGDMPILWGEHLYQASFYVTKDSETSNGKLSIVIGPGQAGDSFNIPQKLMDRFLAKLKEKL